MASGAERYTMMNGKEATLKEGDMYMADGSGVISSVLYGPDTRTRITPATTAALFVVYAPEGITRQAVLDHLSEIERGAHRFAPTAQTELLDLFGFS